MNNINKNVRLIVAILLIMGAIGFIEITKPPFPIGSRVPIAILPNESAAPTTPEETAAASSTAWPTITNPHLNKSAYRNQIIRQKSIDYPPAVEIIPGGQFINTEPFKLKDLIGKKVILVDFWTYTCINCLRTLPYLEAWDAKYRDQGLVILGIHAPEFEFEKDYNNVSYAVKRLGVKYPVMQDNDHATWAAYQNQYWPHEYLIDIDGYIVHDKIGEGNYDESEREIQTALKERDQALGLPDTVPTGIVNPVSAIIVNPTGAISPETYFGSGRNEYLGNGTSGVAGMQQLSIPAAINANTLYLSGSWDFQSEFAKNLTSGAKIIYQYRAKNVYLVGRADTNIKVTIMVDGKPVGSLRGADVSSDGTMIVRENRLYNLIKDSDYNVHTLEIIINDPGLLAYTFTFG